MWQFSPTFEFDKASFERILDLLPTNTDEAAAIVEQHDTRVMEPCITPARRRKLRHAIEFRHESFVDPAFIRLLRKYRAALVLSDSVAGWPYAEDLTSDFVYMRLRGTQTAYGGKYEDSALDRWAARIKEWAAGREPEDAQRVVGKPARRRTARDVFCYFDNDKKVQAPFDARRLMNRLDLEAREAG